MIVVADSSGSTCTSERLGIGQEQRRKDALPADVGGEQRPLLQLQRGLRPALRSVAWSLRQVAQVALLVGQPGTNRSTVRCLSLEAFVWSSCNRLQKIVADEKDDAGKE